MRKGQYAYRADEIANRFLKRPRVELFDAFPSPDMSDYFGEPKMLEEQAIDQHAITDDEEECKDSAINAGTPS
jgi:hypothetical protein